MIIREKGLGKPKFLVMGSLKFLEESKPFKIRSIELKNGKWGKVWNERTSEVIDISGTRSFIQCGEGCEDIWG
jgi:hypothetical protein